MKPSMNVRYFMAEFYGSFSLLFVPLVVWQLNGSLVFVGVSVGLTYLFTSSMLLHISHAHFNPIFSLASWLDGRLTLQRLGLYLLAQFSGMLFAWVSLPLAGTVQWDLTIDVPWFQALGMETFLIFMVVYVYVAVSEQPMMRPFLPLSVGVAYSVLASLGLATTGNTLLIGQFLPALIFSPGVVLRVVLSAGLGTVLAMGFYRKLKFQPTVYQSK